MLDLFGSQPDPGFSSYVDLKKRITQKVLSSSVNDMIFQAVKNAFENAMGSESPTVLLSRPERQRLFSQVLKSVLEDMVRRLDERSGGA